MMMKNKNEIMEQNKENLSGYPGRSGCISHIDWGGYNKEIECKDDYPEFLQKIIKFRNTSLRKEWVGSLEHDVRSDTQEECHKKSNELVKRVQLRLDEITLRYKPLDESIDYLILLNS